MSKQVEPHTFRMCTVASASRYTCYVCADRPWPAFSHCQPIFTLIAVTEITRTDILSPFAVGPIELAGPMSALVADWERDIGSFLFLPLY